MNVLVIAPHMDDEVLGMGGTIAKHVQRGDEVTVCVVTNRAYEHRYDDVAIQREQEAAQRAQAVLGYHALRFLGLPDEQLDRALIDVIVPLERLYAQVKPDAVYTCHRGDLHQDHRAAFEATMVVCRALNRHRPQRLLCYEVPSATDQAAPFSERQFIPTVYELMAPEQLEKKVAAMRCYQREVRSFPHPRSPEGIVTYARRRGIEVGGEAAEAFMAVREIRA